MNRRLFASTALAATLVLTPALRADDDDKKKVSSLSIPVTGTITEGGATTPATGTFAIKKFAVVNKQIRAIGTVSLSSAGKVKVIAASMPLVLPQNGSAARAVSALATCDILRLTLGPLDLNLLGLVVHLDQLNLDIVAESGPGNLLGNLLCAVANLLNGTNLSALLQQIVNALNALLAAL